MTNCAAFQPIPAALGPPDPTGDLPNRGTKRRAEARDVHAQTRAKRRNSAGDQAAPPISTVVWVKEWLDATPICRMQVFRENPSNSMNWMH
jgi:hypothetical protein